MKTSCLSKRRHDKPLLASCQVRDLLTPVVPRVGGLTRHVGREDLRFLRTFRNLRRLTVETPSFGGYFWFRDRLL